MLDIGVTARASFDPNRPRRLTVRSEPRRTIPISREVARRLFVGVSGRLEVELHHDLPIGQGLGMSAAGALATGLAVAQVTGRSREGAVRIAHLADLFGGGGLGGVAAILGGGLELRARPGIPPFGCVVRRRFPYPIVLARMGPPLPSPSLLRDPRFLNRVRWASTEGLSRLHRRFSPSTFLAEAETFTDSLGVASPSMAPLLRALRRPGIRSGQTMFGRVVWSVATDAAARRQLMSELAGRNIPAIELAAASVGEASRVRAGTA